MTDYQDHYYPSEMAVDAQIQTFLLQKDVDAFLIRKQIRIVTEANPVVCTKSLKVCKAVYHTANQRNGIKADKQSQNRNGNQ